MKGMSFGKGTGYKSPQLMKKEAAMKMKKNSPMDKPLVGDQHKLPAHLKQKIEAAPTKLRGALGKLSRKAGEKFVEGKKAGEKIGKAVGEVTKKSITSSAKTLPGGTRTSTRKKMSSPNKIMPSARGIIEAGKNIQKKTLQKKMLQDNPPGSAGRKAVYDRLGWKYDDTIPGYNRDGSKKSTMTDPKKTDITGGDYTTGSKKGRKYTGTSEF